MQDNKVQRMTLFFQIVIVAASHLVIQLILYKCRVIGVCKSSDIFVFFAPMFLAIVTYALVFWNSNIFADRVVIRVLFLIKKGSVPWTIGMKYFRDVGRNLGRVKVGSSPNDWFLGRQLSRDSPPAQSATHMMPTVAAPQPPTRAEAS